MSNSTWGLRDILGFIVAHPLNERQRARAVWRFLRWQLASRLMPFPIALPFVDDLSLMVERGMAGATGNYYCGLHEAEDMAFVLHFMRPGDVFYDIGANVGSYSLLAVAAGVTQVVGFEPSTKTSARYERNVATNALGEIVTVYRVALGSSTGELTFTCGADSTNHVVADDEQAQATEVVPVRRLDEYFARGKPSFIKMDVEGFETQVLAGASNALADPSLMGILIEDNGSNDRYGSKGSVADIIRANGFTIFRYDLSNRRLTAGGTAKKASENLLFLRDGVAASDRVRSARRFRLINGWI